MYVSEQLMPIPMPMPFSSQVILSSVYNVLPASPTPQPCWKSLSNIDFMLAGSTYSKFIYYYKPPRPSIPFSSLVSKLKESLAITLVHFFVLAGRVQPGEDGRPQVNCNDSGIPLRVAHTEARFDDWENVQECTIEDHLNTPDESITDFALSPIFQIQVTQFGCGGIALGCAVSEVVVDGYSAAEFFHAWSRLHRGLSITPPLFNADLFKARDPPAVKVPVRDYVTAAVLPEGSSSVNHKMVVDSASMYQRHVLTVTASGIEDLIREVESGPFGYGHASSFEALAGLIWKSMTEVRGLADDAITTYLYPLSCRGNKRFKDPPIPMSYLGNAIHVACLPARAGDIRSRHVSYAARLIHDDIANISGEYIRSAIDWMEIQYRSGLQVGFNTDYYDGKNVHCTSMYIFPIYKTDFGWGKPVHYSLVPHPWFGDGVAFILPAPEGGRTRRISIAMPEAEMGRLLRNHLILKFASPPRDDDGTEANSSSIRREPASSSEAGENLRTCPWDIQSHPNEFTDRVESIHRLLSTGWSKL